MVRCTVQFHKSLHFFLPTGDRTPTIASRSYITRSIKDLIESYGIPHVEVGLIQVNGSTVDFDYLVADRDHIVVYPAKTPPPPTPDCLPSFVADVHLKTLARRLRMLGFDTRYDPATDDPELADQSANESRFLLTRDRQLLMRRNVARGMYIRSTDPDQQIVEVIRRYALRDVVRPFARCISCNGTIEKLKDGEISPDVSTRIPEAVRSWCTEFFQCTHCGNVYWKGSHHEKMISTVSRILDAS